MPLVRPIVAMPTLPLAHVPPAVALLKTVVPPTHTVVTPVIGLSRFTVTIVVTKQLPPKV